MEQLIEKINYLLVEEFEVDAEKITPEANLKATLELDSLDYIDMVVVLEHHFGFKVKPEDFISIETIQDFYDYTARRIHTKELV
jgi:acyl carrier protein